MSLSYPHAAEHCALLAHPICSLVDSPTTESFGVDKPTSGNVPDTHEAATAPSGYPRELPWELMTASASRRRTPTLDQVARYAGVSRATVSRVVNGSTSVDPALRKIVAAGGQLRAFPRPVMEAGYKATQELFAEIGAKNAKFRKVHEHMAKFLEDQVLWFRVAESAFDNFMVTGRKAAPKK